MPHSHEQTRVRSRRRADLLLIVGFFAILAYPSVSLIENPEALKARSRLENRALAARPPIWLLAKEPSKFVAQFKAFFEDLFEGRGQLVTINSLVRYKAFEASSKPTVIPGKRGALFFAGEPVVPRHDFGHEAAKFRRILPVTERRLKRLENLIDGRRKWAESMGAKFVFVVTPDKSTTYAELMPESMNRMEGPSFPDQLIAHLKANTKVEIVDLRPAVAAAKAPGRPVFYLRDTHWNHEGAFAGYQELTRWLKREFPAIQPLTWNDVDRREGRHEGDLATMLHIGAYLSEPTTQILLKSPRSSIQTFPYDSTPVWSWAAPPVYYRSGDTRLPKALVYNDSFMLLLMQYLAENFDTSIFIRDQRIVTNTVKGYKPDVVIFECVERTLYYLAYQTDDLQPQIEPEMVAENQAAAAARR